MHVLRSIARSLDLNTRLKSTVTSTDEIDLRIDLHRQTALRASWAHGRCMKLEGASCDESRLFARN